MVVCMCVGKIFSREGTSEFFQSFLQGGEKVVKCVFCHSN